MNGFTEPFTIQIANNGNTLTWTRATLDSAKLFAVNIARKTGLKATVTLTETGWVEYVAEPVAEERA